jgi:hypothetical protein
MLEKRLGGEIDLAGDADAIGKCERAMEPKIILELIAGSRAARFRRQAG